METKYLWDIIDKLRDELSISSDGINDLNDALKDMRKENNTLDSSLKECVNEYNKLEKENDYDGLKKKYDYLKLAIVDQNDDIKTLKKENDSLKDEAIKWNRKYNKLNANYNNDIDVSYKLDDKHIDIIKGLEEHVEVANNHIVDLQEEIKTLKNSSRHPKEYQKESEEYFHHNPQCKKLLFFMIDGNNFDDDGCYNAYLLDDECIAKIDNS